MINQTIHVVIVTPQEELLTTTDMIAVPAVGDHLVILLPDQGFVTVTHGILKVIKRSWQIHPSQHACFLIVVPVTNEELEAEEWTDEEKAQARAPSCDHP